MVLSDTELQQRLIDLETRVAFQEHALTELSDALASARSEEARNSLLLYRALDEIKHLRAAFAASPLTGEAGSEPPPPHY